ncbi:MAG TPA: hypothetical protein VN972_00555, partial [Methylomirabilota bacterium]|nr:hypothetical protein [Methylomirabilota bacterium]
MLKIGLALAVGALGAAIICGLLAFAAHAAPSAPPKTARAAITADVAGRDVAVTVYNENLGVVKDRR